MVEKPLLLVPRGAHPSAGYTRSTRLQPIAWSPSPAPASTCRAAASRPSVSVTAPRADSAWCAAPPAAHQTESSHCTAAVAARAAAAAAPRCVAAR
eukprot:2985470-Prymnesium_polylepis.1